mmetsp:Transcript_7125/g.24763  ORF Transcript_7125/g.24763 Transcript_7125/m.24763 type:complete len:155 (-) Transcript_7125:184-648(-)
MQEQMYVQYNKSDSIPAYDALTTAKHEQVQTGQRTQASKVMGATVDTETTRSTVNSHMRNQLSADSINSTHSFHSSSRLRKFDLQAELAAQLKIHQTLQFRSHLLELNYKKKNRKSCFDAKSRTVKPGISPSSTKIEVYHVWAKESNCYLLRSM